MSISLSSDVMPAPFRLLQPQLGLPESSERTPLPHAGLGCDCAAAAVDAVDVQAESSAC